MCLSGWEYKKAVKGLKEGAEKDRQQLLAKRKKKNNKKIAWVTRFDPRTPAKSQIIKKYLHLLHTNPENQKIFPKRMLIAADRRRKNLGEMYKPTTPKRLKVVEPGQKPGFWKCNKKCDTCAHSEDTVKIKSPWDGRMWFIRHHITCQTENVIYIIQCLIHPDQIYVGSTKNLKLRWANHKSDIKFKKAHKCQVAHHVSHTSHPEDTTASFIKIVAIETVKTETKILERELDWQANLGTIFTGLNKRVDLVLSTEKRVQFNS